MHAQRQKPVDFVAERLCIALSVSPNCESRIQGTDAVPGLRARRRDRPGAAGPGQAVALEQSF
jgi:hypothetical protein